MVAPVLLSGMVGLGRLEKDGIVLLDGWESIKQAIPNSLVIPKTQAYDMDELLFIINRYCNVITPN
jgi:hypothetical protein